jgi:hypothetical protein
LQALIRPLNTFTREGKDLEPDLEPDTDPGRIGASAQWIRKAQKHADSADPDAQHKVLGFEKVKVSWHSTKLTALPENSANFLASNSAIFVQRTISPMTAFTLGWLMTVVNQRVTFTYGFLQIQPRVTLSCTDSF